MNKSASDEALLYDHMGAILIKLQDYDKAMEYLKKSNTLLKSEHGEIHYSLIFSTMEIGSLYKFNRKISEAEEYYGKALDICFKTLDNVNPQVYDVEERIGQLF